MGRCRSHPALWLAGSRAEQRFHITAQPGSYDECCAGFSHTVIVWGGVGLCWAVLGWVGRAGMGLACVLLGRAWPTAMVRTN